MNRLSDAQIAAQIRARTKAMREALANTKMDAPSANIGNLAGIAPNWEAGRTYEVGEVFTYDGKVGFARQNVLAQEVYPPFSTGTEAIYGVRPCADENGVYPYAYNMRAEAGMKVREGETVYECIQTADPLLYPPSTVPALFKAVEA